MRATCRRDGCWNAVLSWLSDWCGPACQFADLDESGVDMRLKLRDEPGARYDSLRYAAAAADYELVDEHRLKQRTAEYVAAGGVVPQSGGGRPVLADLLVDAPRWSMPHDPPRTRRPLFAGLIRRLWP